MKEFKISEFHLQNVGNLLSEFPIKHETLIKSIVNILNTLQEIVKEEPKLEEKKPD